MKVKGRIEVLEAYSDESGNSGSHIFDDAQPWFWVGTLIATAANIDRIGASTVGELCRRLDTPELHGTELRLAGIEAIADDLLKVLDGVRARFVFTALEKVHLASTKFVDTVFDSDVNKAVSPLHYGVRGLRMVYAATITECLTRRDQEEFWEAYRTANGDSFRAILHRVDARIQSRARGRTKEILRDAFAWAIDHPTQVLDFRRARGDAPNMVAFGLMFDGIHAALAGLSARVRRFVHDEQEEFGREMKAWFDALRSWTGPKGSTAFMTDLQRIKVIQGDFELGNSKDTPGLQLIDVLLWLYRRSLLDHLRAFPKATALLEWVVERTTLQRFSREQMLESARQALDEIAKIPDEQLDHERGRAFLREVEQHRLRRMGLDVRGS